MRNACMSTLIQIRNVPVDVHEKLKARAASRGLSLNAYMLELLQCEAGTAAKAESSLASELEDHWESREGPVPPS